jgi:hypothetical protein
MYDKLSKNHIINSILILANDLEDYDRDELIDRLIDFNYDSKMKLQREMSDIELTEYSNGVPLSNND